MNKNELRKRGLDLRLAINEQEYQERNRLISEFFFSSFDISFLKVIHVFLPIVGKREPDIWPLIERLRREYPHLRIVVPKVNGQELENYFFEGLHQLRTGAFGISEPFQGLPAESLTIDMVLVPTLLCDQNGNRLGYGKGFYDRFLKNCKRDCLKIGVSLLDPISETIPTDNYDVPLDHLLYPGGVISFK